MFTKILIANRGEIACRIMRTARRLGIRTVAVYSEADRTARHVREADEAVYLGAAPSRDSYLKGDAIIAAAKATGAQAIHPGYGFLSQNAEFADACQQAGVVFIGPSGDAMRAMGGKSAAKALMEKSSVPILPGYHGDKQDLKTLKDAANRIGFPVLIKASAGGGGKGMRLVEKAADFDDALEAARREAKSSFGDDHVLIEKYLTKPRHVEIQVIGDTFGTMLYLFERDCSLQRRHQKVVEEAPAPNLSQKLRKEMGEAATRAASAVGYVNAGTIEFLLDADGKFYFMEMNTRLQVEHPVTELITGVDLVEWQLRVAAGERLPKAQADLKPHGHAVEVRLYAEDPAHDFRPATGTLRVVDLPADADGLRVDSGVEAGDTVTPHYDPMLAKIIAWGHDRGEALRRLSAALSRCRVVGVTTNLIFLRALIDHPAFKAEELDTGFIPRYRDAVMPPPPPATAKVLALAALAHVLDRPVSADPWSAADAWRPNLPAMETLTFWEGDTAHTVTLHHTAGVTVQAMGTTLAAKVRRDGLRLQADLNGHAHAAYVVTEGHTLTVAVDEGLWELRLDDPMARAALGGVVDTSLAAPLPGTVIKVMAKPGTAVAKGADLVILEAMKTEHHITAPADGVVDAVNCAVGEHVEKGMTLVAFTPAKAEAKHA
jgi:3-methylcrotonyl-CoA carboxylase alpha subunit